MSPGCSQEHSKNVLLCPVEVTWKRRAPFSIENGIEKVNGITQVLGNIYIFFSVTDDHVIFFQ